MLRHWEWTKRVLLQELVHRVDGAAQPLELPAHAADVSLQRRVRLCQLAYLTAHIVDQPPVRLAPLRGREVAVALPSVCFQIIGNSRI